MEYRSFGLVVIVLHQLVFPSAVIPCLPTALCKEPTPGLANNHDLVHGSPSVNLKIKVFRNLQLSKKETEKGYARRRNLKLCSVYGHFYKLPMRNTKFFQNLLSQMKLFSEKKKKTKTKPQV